MAKRVFKTTEVFIEEISKFTPSVKKIESAIPVFIGSTEKAIDAIGNSLFHVPVRISSMVEFEYLFGNPSAQNEAFSITLSEITADNALGKVDVNYNYSHINPKYMAYQVAMFMENGGSACYIYSTGDFSTPLNKNVLKNALLDLDTIDEVTILTICDRPEITDVKFINDMLLKDCATHINRFTILDIWGTNDKEFEEIGMGTINVNNAIDSFRTRQIGHAHLKFGSVYYPWIKTTIGNFLDETKIHVLDDSVQPQYNNQTLYEIGQQNDALHNKIKKEIIQFKMTLPTSGALAGIYALVDRERGVWKAPANIGLKSVIGPVSAISDAIQSTMNIDNLEGKSVNAIRYFTGKGTLVWGGRTLAGNDNEWRYVSVRRCISMVEESVKKATDFVVFESNNAKLWKTLQLLIEDYLLALWRQGALQGAKQGDAFFVRIGLGITMTNLDILEGRLNIEIGLAMVRPAEFIIIKITQKVDNSPSA